MAKDKRNRPKKASTQLRINCFLAWLKEFKGKA
jgi:hypothetical protein